jgi:hypothetical protein
MLNENSGFIKYYSKLLNDCYDGIKEAQIKADDIINKEDKYTALKLSDKLRFRTYYLDQVKHYTDKAENLASNFTDSFIDDLDYIFKRDNIDEKNYLTIFETIIKLTDFERSGIDIKRYDEIEKKLKRAAAEIEKYGGIAKIKLPDKPEKILNLCITYLEDDGIDANSIDEIVKIISNRRRLPKGQQERKEQKEVANTLMDEMKTIIASWLTPLA